MTVVIKKPSAPNPVSSRIVTEGSLPNSSFRLVERRVKRRLIVSVEGQPKQGKTHFALTSPGPIAYLNFDFGTEGVVDKPEFLDKEVHIADYRLEFPYEQPKAKAVYDQFVNDYKAALGSDVRSVVVDTATEGWEVIRLAKLGKLQNVMPIMYAPINREYQELIRKAYDSDCNLILLHKQKKEYVNDQWSGKYERAGFGETGYAVQASVQCFKDAEGWKVRIIESRQNPKVDGLVIAEPSFAKLGVAIFPDTTVEDWQ